MGYESRVIIARRFEVGNSYRCTEILAELKLSKMGDGFFQLFDKYIDFEFYAPYVDGDIEVRTDKYGDRLRYASFKDVYKWCLANKYRDNYRRMDMLIALMQSIECGWYDEIDEFIVIHYGY